MGQGLDFEALDRLKRPTTAECSLCLDPDAAEAWHRATLDREEALIRLERAQTDAAASLAQAQLDAAEEHLEQLRPQVEEKLVTFRFEAMGGDEYESLIRSNPPTERQKTEARKQGERMPPWNVDAFAPKLVALSLVEPEMGETEVERLWHSPKWNNGELQSLFLAALEANTKRRVVDLGKGSGKTLSSASS